LWFRYLHHVTSRWAAWKWSVFAWLIYPVDFCVVNDAQILNIGVISLCCDVFNVRMWTGRNILNNWCLWGSCCHKIEPVSTMHDHNHFVSENGKHSEVWFFRLVRLKINASWQCTIFSVMPRISFTVQSSGIMLPILSLFVSHDFLNL